MENAYVIGMDYGTDSVRALLVNAITGEEIDSAVFNYPRWAKGLYCDASGSQFRQHPLDYIEGLQAVIGGLVRKYPEAAKDIKAIAVDTTASTPCIVDKECRPLALSPEYAENPNAMFVLWKDHTGEKESEEINALCAEGEDYSLYTGSYYSSENFWSKIAHIFRTDPAVKEKAWGAVELCDFIPAVLTGVKDVKNIKMGHCVAAQKWMWAEKWGGYPPASFFGKLDPDLPAFAGRLNPENYTCDIAAGTITAEWADRLGLPHGVKVGVGNVDSHSGAVGAGVDFKTVVLNLGTSSCYMAVVPPEVMGDRIVEGAFGQVESSIIPGLIGFEVGLSAFGDVYAWFRRLLSYPLTELVAKSDLIDEKTKQKLIEEAGDRILAELNAAASELPQRPDTPFATDWLNGRRSPSPNTSLTGSVMGLRISTTAPEIYYALVEATTFATKAILDHLMANGVEIDNLVAAGGISRKSPFVMQMLADVLGKEISVTGCLHTCALGAAMYAATVAGIYDNVSAAQKAMGKPPEGVYTPDMEKHKFYLQRYELYKAVGEFTEKLTQNN